MAKKMAESIAQPNALNLTSNVAENWRYFKQEFELYLVAAGSDTKPDKQKSQKTLKAEIQQKYPELFKGNGSLPGTHSFVLKDGSTGVIRAPRRVALRSDQN